MDAPPRRGIVTAVARLRCPMCRQGPTFRGAFEMRDACPVCGYVFEREPGYFVGAMYVSYALAVLLYWGIVEILGRLLPSWSVFAVVGLGLPVFLPFVPALFRYARVIWMHLDRAIDRSP